MSMRRTTTLNEYRSRSLRIPRQTAMTWAMIGGIIAGVVLPLLLLAFMTLSPIVSLVAYIGLAICPFLFPALAAGVVSLHFLAKASRQARQINNAPDAPIQAQQSSHSPQQQANNAAPGMGSRDNASYHRAQANNGHVQASPSRGRRLGRSSAAYLLALLQNAMADDEHFDPTLYNLIDVPRTNQDNAPKPYQAAQQNDRPTTYQRLIRLQEDPYNIDIKNGGKDSKDANRRLNNHPEFFGPISQEVMKHPVLAHDGKHYDRSWIEAHMEASKKSVNGLGWKSPLTNVWIASSDSISVWIDTTKEQFIIREHPFMLMDDQSLIVAMDDYADVKEAQLGITSLPLNLTPATVTVSPSSARAGQADQSHDQSPVYYPNI